MGYFMKWVSKGERDSIVGNTKLKRGVSLVKKTPPKLISSAWIQHELSAENGKCCQHTWLIDGLLRMCCSFFETKLFCLEVELVGSVRYYCLHLIFTLLLCGCDPMAQAYELKISKLQNIVFKITRRGKSDRYHENFFLICFWIYFFNQLVALSFPMIGNVFIRSCEIFLPWLVRFPGNWSK